MSSAPPPPTRSGPGCVLASRTRASLRSTTEGAPRRSARRAQRARRARRPGTASVQADVDALVAEIRAFETGGAWYARDATGRLVARAASEIERSRRAGGAPRRRGAVDGRRRRTYLESVGEWREVSRAATEVTKLDLEIEKLSTRAMVTGKPLDVNAMRELRDRRSAWGLRLVAAQIKGVSGTLGDVARLDAVQTSPLSLPRALRAPASSRVRSRGWRSSPRRRALCSSGSRRRSATGSRRGAPRRSSARRFSRCARNSPPPTPGRRRRARRRKPSPRWKKLRAAEQQKFRLKMRAESEASRLYAKVGELRETLAKREAELERRAPSWRRRRSRAPRLRRWRRAWRRSRRKSRRSRRSSPRRARRWRRRTDSSGRRLARVPARRDEERTGGLGGEARARRGARDGRRRRRRRRRAATPPPPSPTPRRGATPPSATPRRRVRRRRGWRRSWRRWNSSSPSRNETRGGLGAGLERGRRGEGGGGEGDVGVARARARVADVEERLAAKSAALREALADSGPSSESLTMEADFAAERAARELMAERLAGRVAELEATETRLGDAASAAEQKRRSWQAEAGRLNAELDARSRALAASASQFEASSGRSRMFASAARAQARRRRRREPSSRRFGPTPTRRVGAARRRGGARLRRGARARATPSPRET